MSGLYTTFDTSFDTFITKLQARYEIELIDLYISTWDKSVVGLAAAFQTAYDVNPNSSENLKKAKEKYEGMYDNLKFHIDIEPCSKSSEIMLYHNNYLNIEKPNKDSYLSKKQIEIVSMWYKIMRSFYIVDKNIHYDLFIRMRCDSCFDFLPQDTTDRVLFVSPYVWESHTLLSSECDMISDQVWISNDYETMRSVCNGFNFIKKLWEDKIIGEKLFFKIVGEANVDVRRFFFSHKIYRMNGHIQINGTDCKKDAQLQGLHDVDFSTISKA